MPDTTAFRRSTSCSTTDYDIGRYADVHYGWLRSTVMYAKILFWRPLADTAATVLPSRATAARCPQPVYYGQPRAVGDYGVTQRRTAGNEMDSLLTWCDVGRGLTSSCEQVETRGRARSAASGEERMRLKPGLQTGSRRSRAMAGRNTADAAQVGEAGFLFHRDQRVYMRAPASAAG